MENKNKYNKEKQYTEEYRRLLLELISQSVDEKVLCQLYTIAVKLQKNKQGA